MDLHAYFNRIGYTGSTDPTLDTLKALHRAHLLAIPFENLNIHMPLEIILDEDLLFDKIVNHQRGGFCLEQNGLFSAILRQLGFDVQPIEGNVFRANTESYGEPMTHMTLITTIEGIRYLTDVGFGAGFSEPLELDNPAVQQQDVGAFKIEHDGEKGVYYAQLNGSETMRVAYRFFLTPHELGDYRQACSYLQTSPLTHFTQKRICTKMTPDGRITLTDNEFIVTTLAGERTEIPVLNEAHFHSLLRDEFGINVQTRRPQPMQV